MNELKFRANGAAAPTYPLTTDRLAEFQDNVNDVSRALAMLSPATCYKVGGLASIGDEGFVAIGGELYHVPAASPAGMTGISKNFVETELRIQREYKWTGTSTDEGYVGFNSILPFLGTGTGLVKTAGNQLKLDDHMLSVRANTYYGANPQHFAAMTYSHGAVTLSSTSEMLQDSEVRINWDGTVAVFGTILWAPSLMTPQITIANGTKYLHNYLRIEQEVKHAQVIPVFYGANAFGRSFSTGNLLLVPAGLSRGGALQYFNGGGSMLVDANNLFTEDTRIYFDMESFIEAYQYSFQPM